jgi:adenylate cyclase
VTIFFSDVRGFTAFSEKRTPEEVVEMLNEYFEVMVSIINRNGGVVDKFIGDAIMAVWGAPTPTPEDTSKALKACLEMRQGLWELNKKREARGHEPLIIGMGLHAGKAISGTIGSAERMEYTVIGDTVNMTSRIESSTKAFGADLLVSEVVAEKVGNSFKMEYAGSAEVKGKTEPLKLYKVRALKDSNGDWLDITTPYSDYKKGDADKVKVAS